MSPLGSPTAKTAGCPFDSSSNADVILRSSDNVDFFVYKLLLSLASPIFKDMFTLPQASPSPSEPHPAFPVVDVTEDAATLERLLQWCDPRTAPAWDTLEDIQAVLRAADKYDMGAVVRCAGRELATFAAAQPVRIFAIAWQYRLVDVVRAAAAHTLRHTLRERANVPELRHIPATALQSLHDYYFACAREACATMHDLQWMNRTFVWSACPYNRYSVDEWWTEYVGLACAALLERPCRATIMEATFEQRPLQKASECKNCKEQCIAHLLKFKQLFVAEMEARIAHIDLLVVF